MPLRAPRSETRIFDAFLAACRERPDARAIVHPNGAWTYAQLESASRNLATRLLDLPAADDVVALYSHRTPELVVAMLACARAGLTFAVLDAAYPVERLEQLLAVVRPGRFVTIGAKADRELLGKLTQAPAVIRLDAATLSSLACGAPPPDDRLDRMHADAIAYLLFTSGTTGVPKCIATSHAPLVHFIDWYRRVFSVDSHARFSMLSGLGHDPILRDVFVPLSTGAELHVPPEGAVLDPVKLYGWLAGSRVTHAHVTPQLCRILCAGRRDREPLGALRFVMSGGDMLRAKLARELGSLAPAARVVNFYGATETPQATGYHVFDPNSDVDVVPVGRGIDDAQLLVLDERLELAAIGAPGQIAIRTKFLSAGYRGDVGLTAAKFVVNPITKDPDDRMYLTGDVGHYRADGEVVLEGRLDDQVKIRGFRVELREVVHHLERVAGIREAVVLSEPMPDGENRLVAFLVADSAEVPGAPAAAAVRDELSASLPTYMVPARCVWLPRLPLLPNGKIDRASLARLGAADGSVPASPIAADPIEAQILIEWRELLACPTIDLDSTFVQLGGDSLSFIEASVHLETVLGALPDGWEKLSIRELARHKRARRSPWTRIDSSVLLRAVSIVAVVAGHSELPNLAGSVLALFVVSGMSFGRYLVPNVLATGRTTPIVRLLLKIAIPAVLYALLVNVVFRLPKWPGMLLVNNLVSPDSHESGIGFWFIDVLAQNFVLLAVLLSVRSVRDEVSRDPFRFALAAAILFDVVAALAPHVWDTSQLYDRVPQQYLAPMCLGWAIVNAGTPRRKLLVTAATLVTFAGFASRSESVLVFPFVATFFVVACARVSLPVLAGRIIHVVAGASLFIYLIDHQVGLVLTKAGLGSHTIFMVIVAVSAGIAVHRLWQRATAIALRQKRETPSVAVQPVLR